MTEYVKCRASHGHVMLAARDMIAYVGPGDAVKFHRCLMGETNSAFAEDANGKPCHLFYYDDPNRGVTWEMQVSGKTMFQIDYDEAPALAWALRSAARDVVAGIEPGAATVWLLSAWTVLTGDTTETGADLVDGAERAFASYPAALEALHGFATPFIRGCETEAHWDSNDVDETLFGVFGDLSSYLRPTDRVWTYDGLTRSCVFRICKLTAEDPK